MLKKSNYRSDIDGLRAFAVLAVLFFHFFPHHLKGGFAGVDVFFVISGYLVTGILYSNIQEEKFSFKEFYFKRVRRLFPSLIAVLVVCCMAGSLLLVADEFANFGKQLFSSALFSTNFVLFSESGYFDRSSDLKPLLHIWSLSIEEQFYIFWPFLIYFLGKNKKVLIYSLLGITIVSLGLNLGLTKNHQAFSFYLLPTRLWELAIGGLLIFVKPAEVQGRIRSVLSLAGFGLILFSFYILNQNKQFPGWWVLLPVLGTCLVIIAGESSIVNKMISDKRIVYIGLISYPLYLWHWPLISYAHIVTSGSVGLTTKIVLLIASLILAVLSYEYLEKPLKAITLSFRSIAKMVTPLVVLGLVGFSVWSMNGVPTRFKRLEAARVSKEAFKAGKDSENGRICNEKVMEIEMCSISDATRPPTVILIGDSHASHLYPGLKKYFDSIGENLLLLGRSGTSPLMNVVSKRNPETTLDDVFEYIQKTKSIHTVVLSAFWGNYFEEAGVQLASFKYKNLIQDKLNPGVEKQEDVFNKAFSRTLENLAKMQKKAIFFHDIPSLPFPLDSCLPRPFVNKLATCQFSEEAERIKQEGYRKAVEPALAKALNVKVFDPMSFLCEQGRCPITRDNTIMYSDDFHLSIDGAVMLMDKLFESGNI
ncbi:acyltransferase family protein [Bdellovibrio sp. HCB337]|uniref:acyltransferase family protein n=1 Tax=Bdellovibrio sp. HCB337 TaxID=3394358 RepID=UPI0039A6415E